MQMQGEFILNPGAVDELAIRNTIVATGLEYYLRQLFRAEALLPGTFYIGLSNAPYDVDSDLATLQAGENTIGVNGYARQAVTRDAAGFAVSRVNNSFQALSASVTFTCSGGAWAKSWDRLFLCDVASGAGLLYAVSGLAPAPRAVGIGQGPTVAYKFSLRG